MAARQVYPRAVIPQKKTFPHGLTLQEQHQLLTHPETNPTRYVPFENASTFKFRAEASTASRVNAWWLADAAWLAYWSDKDAALKMFRDGAGLTAEYAAEEGAEAYFASCPDFAIVTFRGTQPDTGPTSSTMRAMRPSPGMLASCTTDSRAGCGR